MIPNPPLLKLKGLRKRFGGVVALDGIDFDLRAGEIHALLGENGAGKSTLIKALAGIQPLDAGEVWFNGAQQHIASVGDADRLGIRVIHQELSLAPNLSVAENIFLGREPTFCGLLTPRRMRDAARSLVARLGLGELRDVSVLVSELSIAHAQLVEIARALSTSVRVLILDEPTSSLSAAETEALFATLGRLRAAGVGIIYISHRLEEIARLADRITVLRNGRSIGTQASAGIDRRKLVRWMVGRDIVDHFRRPAYRPGDVAIEVRGLRGRNVNGVSLDVRYGEILGLAGLVGSGRSEFARTLFGIDAMDAGVIRIDGSVVRIRNPRDALKAGIVLVPEDRKGQGLIMMQSVAFNLSIPWTADWNPGLFPSAVRKRQIVQRAITAFQIKARDPESAVGTLSGGNQQKVLVSRWMEHPPKVLILDEPTRGVDVGAREEMFAIIARLVENGMAVILISSDLLEVMNLSHRVAIYRDGRVLDIVPAGQTTIENVMDRLIGAANDAQDSTVDACLKN